jgi:hypothetical protein
MRKRPTYFAALCHLNDAFYDVALHMPSGPDKDRMDGLVRRLDVVAWSINAWACGIMPTLTVMWETTIPHKEDAMPRRATIFEALCHINDDFAGIAMRMEPGPEKDRLESLVQRLDAVIDRTIGVQEVELKADEGGTLPCD